MLSCSNDITIPCPALSARERILGIVGPMILEQGTTRETLRQAISACGWSAALALEESPALDEIAAVCALFLCYSSECLS